MSVLLGSDTLKDSIPTIYSLEYREVDLLRNLSDVYYGEAFLQKIISKGKILI